MTDYRLAARVIAASPNPGECLESFMRNEVEAADRDHLLEVREQSDKADHWCAQYDQAVAREAHLVTQVEQLRGIAEHWRLRAEAAEQALDDWLLAASHQGLEEL